MAFNSINRTGIIFGRSHFSSVRYNEHREKLQSKSTDLSIKVLPRKKVDRYIKHNGLLQFLDRFPSKRYFVDCKIYDKELSDYRNMTSLEYGKFKHKDEYKKYQLLINDL